MKALIAILLVVVVGCDNAERISRLEKQTKELKAEVSKNRAVADYDLDARCSRDAQAWFNENYPPDKKTLVLNRTNHYNKSLNKCFVFVENHYTVWGNLVNGAWVNDMSVWDVYENSEYGRFTVNHLFSDSKSRDLLIACELSGKKCTTVEQFNALVQPYMRN